VYAIGTAAPRVTASTVGAADANASPVVASAAIVLMVVLLLLLYTIALMFGDALYGMNATLMDNAIV